jgi:hypothetical protein
VIVFVLAFEQSGNRLANTVLVDKVNVFDHIIVLVSETFEDHVLVVIDAIVNLANLVSTQFTNITTNEDIQNKIVHEVSVHCNVNLDASHLLRLPGPNPAQC